MTAEESFVREKKAVCPESTIESAAERNPTPKKVVPPVSIVNDKSTSKGESKLACESTIESSLRRDFIKKAALVTAGVAGAALGASAIAKRIIPESSASNPAGYQYCNLYVKYKVGIGTCSPGEALCVIGTVLASNGVSCGPAIAGHTCVGFGVKGVAYGKGWGVYGLSCTGPGVSGISYSGTGVEAVAGCKSAIPLVAKAASCQCSPLQEWQNSSGSPLSVVDKSGNLGIGTITPKAKLEAVACSGTAILGNAQGSATYGVKGTTTCGTGILGCSSSGPGVEGFSGTSYGVYGSTPGGFPYAGVYGYGKCCGVKGESNCGTGVFGLSCHGAGIRGISFGNNYGVFGCGGYTGVAGQGKIQGVSGTTFCANGVGVFALAASPDAIPLVANGWYCQSSHLQEWRTETNSGTETLSVVDKNGNFGIGTANPSAKLDVVSSGPSCVPIIAQGASGQSSPLQEWRNSTCTPLSVVNKCGWLGLGTCSPATTLQINGSIGAKVATVTSNYSMSAKDFGVLANATSGALNVTLPAAGTALGMIVFIKKVDSSANAVNVVAVAPNLIEGEPSQSLSIQFASLTLISDGVSNWYFFASENVDSSYGRA